MLKSTFMTSLHCYVQTPALLYLINMVVLLLLFIYLLRFGSRSSTINWFRIFLIMSLGYTVVADWMHCTAGASSYSLAVDLYGLTGALTLPLLFIFMLYFMNKERYLESTWLRLAIFSFTVYYLYVFWRTDDAVSRDITQTTYAYGLRYIKLGSQSATLGLLELVGYFTPLIWAISYYFHLDDPLKKHEARLIIWAFIILIVPSIIIEGALPGVLHITLPPISPITSIIACSLITYALSKYGLRIFNLSNVGSDLMQVLPGGLIVLDHTNTIQYANDGGAAMLGYTRNELAGTSIRRLFPDARAYHQFQARILGQAVADHPVTGREAQFITQSGKTLAVSLNAAGIYAGQELTNQLIAFTDITPLKQAEAALEAEKAGVEHKVIERTHELAAAQAQLTASINSLPLGYIRFDDGGAVLATNPSAHQILRLTGQTCTLATLSKMLGGFDLAGLVHSCLEHHQSHEVKELEVGARFLRLYVAPIAGERRATIGVVMLIEDITETKVLERSKDEFFSIASHELRTPLTSIRGNSSLMIDYYKEVLKDPNLREMVHDVHESSTRLIGIVNDFLDVSRLEQGRMVFNIAQIEMEPLLRNVAGDLETVAKAQKTKLILDPSLKSLPSVVADPNRVKQIVFNLIGNSLKFTENGKVTVAATVTDGNLTITVTDTGRGISPAAQNLLFHKFQQGGASLLTRDTVKGTGLGLYISRRLAEGMDGKIWLDHSEEGKGSTFAFSLPLVTPERLAAAAAAAAQAGTNSATGLTAPKAH
jgi:PAS domain S-box-containing protein